MKYIYQIYTQYELLYKDKTKQDTLLSCFLDWFSEPALDLEVTGYRLRRELQANEQLRVLHSPQLILRVSITIFFYQVVIVSVSVGMFVLREYVCTGGCKGRIKMRVKVPGWRGGGTCSTSARRRRRKMSPRLCSGSSRRCCSRAHTAVPGQWTLKQKVLQGALGSQWANCYNGQTIIVFCAL